ncbi:hypothetical protein Hanom_Chr12g01113401 [Helianthus anomalus]
MCLSTKGAPFFVLNPPNAPFSLSIPSALPSKVSTKDANGNGSSATRSSSVAVGFLMLGSA